MNLVLVGLLVGPIYWVLSWAWGLFRNYLDAKRTGFPVLICPFSPDRLPYILLKVPLRNQLETYFPFSGVRPSIFGWEMIDKDALHEKHGHAFILCTPEYNELWSADPEINHIVLSRRRDFPQSIMSINIMKSFGANLIASDGDEWARQRRVVVPNLNERIMRGVWDETVVQANGLVDYMLAQPDGELNSTIDSPHCVAKNVLGQVGYGEPKPFAPHSLPREPDAPMSYIDAVGLCGELIIVSAKVSSRLLRPSFMPKMLRTVGKAMDKLPELCGKMIEERRRAGHTEGARENFLSMLVRLSDEAKRAREKEKQNGGGPGSRLYLTEEEIVGNMFVFTSAGFDTTANTLGFTMTFLAAFPEWQTWMQEEIDHVFGQAGDNRDYATLFTKLPRCLAVMYETLRLVPPIAHVSRHLPEPGLTITTSDGKSHFLKGPMLVYLNGPGMNYRKSLWGEDAHDFSPSRWIAQDEFIGNLSQEKHIEPEQGSFISWSGGPRVCPGMKMSQVEFVTCMATVFARVNVEPVVKRGETMEEARERIYEVAKEVRQRITVQMARPEDVVLRWVER